MQLQKTRTKMFDTNNFNYAIAEILDEDLEIDFEAKESFLAEMKGKIREAILDEGAEESNLLEIFIDRMMKTYKFTELHDLIFNNIEEFHNLYEQQR